MHEAFVTVLVEPKALVREGLVRILRSGAFPDPRFGGFYGQVQSRKRWRSMNLCCSYSVLALIRCRQRGKLNYSRRRIGEDGLSCLPIITMRVM